MTIVVNLELWPKRPKRLWDSEITAMLTFRYTKVIYSALKVIKLESLRRLV